jgi:hypothetical protein
MRINYFDCEYEDCYENWDDVDEDYEWFYGCTHPKGNLTCSLDNKYVGYSDNCELLGGPMEKLLIKQCKDGHRWYADLVGQTVPYLGTVGTEYKSKEPAGYINFVQFEDAEVVNGED